MLDVLVLIQARVGSTRLPGKVLLDLEGKKVIEHVVARVKRSKRISEVFVVTTINKEDLELVKLCSQKGIRIFCGSENDVLDRFYQVAKLLEPKHIVRITADCPLMDASIIDAVIDIHIKSQGDYSTNTLTELYPDGEDVEVFTFESLKKAWKEANLISEREHVTPYIRNNKNLFKHAELKYSKDLHDKRWTLDNNEDFEFIKIIYRNEFFSMDDILKFLDQHPDVEKINNHINRNEGYQKSLRDDNLYNNKMEA